LADAGPAADGERYPDHLDLDGLKLPLRYRFAPGEDDDGVTLTVPLAAVNQVDPKRLDWLVPGLQAERMAALLKSLPKALRRNFVPVPNYVQGLLEVIKPGEQSLTGAMAEQLQRMTGVQFPKKRGIPTRCPVICGCASGWWMLRIRNWRSDATGQ
jgi:ATP-dependent helicase HrpA